MTYEEQEKRRIREKDICIFVHSIAEKVTNYEGVTFLEAMQILDSAKNIIKTNMEKQRATIQPEIRDRWGIIIGVSGTEVPDMKR
ncbi:MAG: hypothetical protein J6D08_16585 [Lachnospiraceae bacterium]|nr:hypothetical protein [Lachnospiraceae bacterium]